MAISSTDKAKAAEALIRHPDLSSAARRVGLELLNRIDKRTGLLAPTEVAQADGTMGPPRPEDVMEEYFVAGTEPVDVAEPALAAVALHPGPADVATLAVYAGHRDGGGGDEREQERTTDHVTSGQRA